MQLSMGNPLINFLFIQIFNLIFQEKNPQTANDSEEVCYLQN